MKHKSRLDRLSKAIAPDDDIVITINYVRDWRGDMTDVAETRTIRLGRSSTRIIENRPPDETQEQD
jgi:hypothetical protein